MQAIKAIVDTKYTHICVHTAISPDLIQGPTTCAIPPPYPLLQSFASAGLAETVMVFVILAYFDQWVRIMEPP